MDYEEQVELATKKITDLVPVSGADFTSGGHHLSDAWHYATYIPPPITTNARTPLRAIGQFTLVALMGIGLMLLVSGFTTVALFLPLFLVGQVWGLRFSWELWAWVCLPPALIVAIPHTVVACFQQFVIKVFQSHCYAVRMPSGEREHIVLCYFDEDGYRADDKRNYPFWTYQRNLVNDFLCHDERGDVLIYRSELNGEKMLLLKLPNAGFALEFVPKLRPLRLKTGLRRSLYQEAARVLRAQDMIDNTMVA